jgi:predicted ATPase
VLAEGLAGGRDDARQALAPVYARFTEGFETTDLRSAREILNALAASV